MSTQFSLDENSAQYQIRAYQPGSVLINTTIYTDSIIVTPSKLIEWSPHPVLIQKDFQIFISLKPHILLIGTGKELIFPSIVVYGHLINLGMGIEFMNTAAACRTYNALTAENRGVIAALIL